MLIVLKMSELKNYTFPVYETKFKIFDLSSLICNVSCIELE